MYDVYLHSLLDCDYGSEIKEKLYHLIRLIIDFNEIYNSDKHLGTSI